MNKNRVTNDTTGPSLTQQHFAEGQNINNMVSRHMRAGLGRNLSNIAQGGSRQPIFGDFSSIDYHDMLNKVTDIDNVFQTLSPKVRTRFRNNPELLLRFCEDPANYKEAVKLGLMQLQEGHFMSPEGDVFSQEDIIKQSEKQAEKQAENLAPKADPESNSHNGSKK